jgi:hypothetical protein
MALRKSTSGHVTLFFWFSLTKSNKITIFDDSKVSKVSRSFFHAKETVGNKKYFFFIILTFLSSFCFFVRILIASFAGEHTLTLPVDHTKRWLILICM